MKEGWEVKKLGEVCKFSQGVQIPLEEQYTTCEKGMIRFLRIIDFTQKGETPRYIYNVDDKYILHDNEIAIVRYGTPGFVCYGKVGAIANNLFKILPKESLFDFAFLKYWLSSEAFQGVIKGSKYGVALQAIKFSTISEIFVPIPPLPEQIRIIEELDLLSNIIEKKRQQLSELDNLAQSIFYDMFGDPVTNEKGWEVKLIGEISTFYNGKAHEKNIVEDSGFLLVNAKFISSCGDIKKYSDKQLFPLYKNDITMVMSDLPNGKTLAKCYLIEKDDTYTLNQRICAFRGYKQNPIFLKYVLNRNKYYLSFDDGNGQTNLRKSDVVNCPIILPPLSLQQLFALKIEAIEKQKALIKQSIAETEELFNSRMDYYFS